MLLALAVFAWSCTGDDDSSDGPLEGSEPSEVHVPVEVGQVVTVGHAMLFNQGEIEARVESVRLLPSGRVDLVGVHTLVLPRDGGGIITVPEFPPKDYPSKPLAEQDVVPAKNPTAGEPETAVELILGVRTLEPGLSRSDVVEVRYVVGKRSFVERYPAQILLCAPFDAYEPGCVGPGE